MVSARRVVSRLALLLAAFSTACLDAPVAGPGSLASISLRPAFSRGAFDAVAVDHLHIVLTRPPSTTPVLDTVVAVTPGAQSVTVQMNIRLESNEDVLSASVDLVGGGTVLYHGTTSLDVKAGQRQDQTPVVTVVYVGPGATAARVRIAPRDTTVLATASVRYTASVFDASSQPLANTPIAWSTPDGALGAITGDGVFTGSGRRGSAAIIATTPTGVADTTHLSLLPVATKLVVVSGNGQSAPAAGQLAQPLVVEADGVDGPVAGVTVKFDAGTSGGSIQPASAITDASGRASAQATLGKTTGTQQFNATSPGLSSAAFSATATAVATNIASAGGDQQSDSVGTTLQPFVALVTDAFGNPAPGATVNWSVVGGTGTLSVSSSTTDAKGQASATYTLSKTVRKDTVRATLAGTQASVLFTASAIARSPAKLVLVSGDAQKGAAGSVLANPMVVAVQDALGQPLSGVQVKFAALAAGAAVSPASAVTDATGQASTKLTLGTVPGAQAFTATVGSLSVQVQASASAGVAAVLVKIAGDGQSGAACSVLPNALVTKVTDSFGNAVAGDSVLWAQTGGPGSHNSVTIASDANGLTAIVYQLPNTAGLDTLTATLKRDSKQSVTFLATITSTVAGACPSTNRAGFIRVSR